MRDLRGRLLDELNARRVLVVVGAGVSLGATGDRLAGWPDLLQSGVDWCRTLGASDQWVTLRREQIRQGELVSAAEEIGRRLRQAREYDDWLEDSVGSLRIRHPEVLEALKRLGTPFATTNYDHLLEQATGLDAVTWRDGRRFERVARGQERGVLHLHGHYRTPESVVLGSTDYANIRSNEFAQAMQQALTAMTTLLLVGYGGGLADPNFTALRDWMRRVFAHSGAWHYRLCLDDELEALQAEHAQERIKLIAYGADHGALAPFLNGLADDLWGPGRGPPEPTPPPVVRDPTPRIRPATEPMTDATTGPATDAITGPAAPPAARPAARPTRAERAGRSGWRAAVAAVGDGLRRRVGVRDRSVPVWVPLALVVALVGGLLVAATVRPASSCPVPLELVVLTTPTKEATIRRLAVEFADRQATPCRRSSVTVFSVPSSSAVAGAVAAGWPVDDLSLGPQPAVWLPDATAEVERVNQRLGHRLASLGSIATSPVVLAVPEPATARVGGARVVPWRTMLDWARAAAGSRLPIGRPDPTSSTAGLLATVELDARAGSSGTPDARLHAVEQTVDPVADELSALCRLGQPGGAARAVIVSEQAMVAYNRDPRLGGSCDTRPPGPERLTAVYAADGTPVLDHPFVLLPAATERDDRDRLARDFFRYLTGPDAQDDLREAGFRDAGGNVGGSLGADDGVLVHDPPAWARPPNGAALTRELAAWQQARRPARALLAMDVSGSMNEELPGPGGRRITAAREAAARAVGLIGDKDQIGLWRFSQSLDGSRDYQELVALGPAGPRAGGGRGSERVVQTLARLRATREDTGLYDTMDAGIARLRRGGSRDAVNALVVVTDGQNDDRNGGVTLADVLDRLRDGRPVLVFLLTFGPARCDAGELGQLAGQELVRCLDGDRIGLERAFEQVAATLWGTGRLAGPGRG